MPIPGFTIPNAPPGSSAELTLQAQPDTVDWQGLGAADAGNGVLSGCTVSALGTPGMAVQVAAGYVSVGNQGYTVSAYASVAIGANSSGNPRFDLVVYRVGFGVIVIPGTANANPVFPTPTWTTDVLLAAVYVANGASAIQNADIINKAFSVQASALGAVPSLGAKLLVVGHSWPAGGGAFPWNRGVIGQLSAMLRARVWNQAVPAAILAETGITPGTSGYGGIGQVLQGVVPPSQPINWRGVYSTANSYNTDDGVTWSPATVNCTTNSTTTLTTAGTFAAIVPGMVIAPNATLGIPAGTYVVAVTSTTTLTMSKAATLTNGTATAVTFTGWYRQATYQGIAAGSFAPAGSGANGWQIVLPAGSSIPLPYGTPVTQGGAWNGTSWLPLIFYGENDIGVVAQKNSQYFTSALEAAICRCISAMVWEENSPMITLAGGTWTSGTYASYGASYGSGSADVVVPNTAGATLSFWTPPDWPGGYVDVGFAVLSILGTGTGAMNFTVDGANVNCLSSGMTPGPLVNFGSPGRLTYLGTSLTTALTSGVSSGTTLAVMALPAAVNSGDSIIVGSGGTTQTFVTTGTAAKGATSIPVTAQNANANYPVGTPVYDVTSNAAVPANCMVVRVPVPAGPHQVIGTVQASPAMAGPCFDYVSFEAPNPPGVIVFGLVQTPNANNASWPMNPQYQDVLAWNTAIQSLLANFPSALFVNVPNLFTQAALLQTALTAGQTGITSLTLQAPGLLTPVAVGDSIQIGSGATGQIVTASAAAAVGATTLSVSSFTSTYAHPIGDPVFDATVAAQYFWWDAVHPNPTGHALFAAAVWQAILTNAARIPQLVAVQAEEAQRPSATQVVSSGTLTVGTGVANAWGKIATLTLAVAADPGDVIEIDVAGLWNAVSGTVGRLDIATTNPLSGAAINWLSGLTSMGVVSPVGLYYNQVGAQATNGLSALQSGGSSATQTDQITGKFRYPVQVADVVNGQVNFVFYGSTSTTTTRSIQVGSGNQFQWSVVNVGPFSYLAEA